MSASTYWSDCSPLMIDALTGLSVVAPATSKPPDACTRWSSRRLAAKTGSGVTSVQPMPSEGRLRPHKTKYWCGRGPAPEFETEQAAVQGPSLEPPTNVLVVCVEEKSRIQALDRTQPELPMRAGSPRRLTATYKCHGATCLPAAPAVCFLKSISAPPLGRSGW